MDKLEQLIHTYSRQFPSKTLNEEYFNMIHKSIPLTRGMCERIFLSDHQGIWTFMKFKVKGKGKKKYGFTIIQNDKSNYILYDNEDKMPVMKLLSTPEYSHITSSKYEHWFPLLKGFGLCDNNSNVLKYTTERKSLSNKMLNRLLESFYSKDDDESTMSTQ